MFRQDANDEGAEDIFGEALSEAAEVYEWSSEGSGSSSDYGGGRRESSIRRSRKNSKRQSRKYSKIPEVKQAQNELTDQLNT